MSTTIELEKKKLLVISEINNVEKELFEIDAELEIYANRIIWHCPVCENDNVWQKGDPIQDCEVCGTPTDQNSLEIAKNNNINQQNRIKTKRDKALSDIEKLKKEATEIDKKIAKIRKSEEKQQHIEVRFRNVIKGFRYAAIGSLIASLLAFVYVFGFMMIGSNGIGFETYLSNVYVNTVNILHKSGTFISFSFAAMFKTMINTAKYTTFGACIVKLLNVSETTNQFRVLFSTIIGNFVEFFNVIIENISMNYQQFFG